MNPPNKPANEIRIGNLKAAIWRNENEGSIRYAVTFNRVYRDADHWRNSDSFGRDDLLVVAKIADQAHTWICSQGREPRPDAACGVPVVSRAEPVSPAVAAARDRLLRGSARSEARPS